MASTSVLDTILWNLRSSDQSIREKALQSFEDYVRSSLASGKSDDGESFWDEVINRVLFPLTSMSDTPQEKLVGIAAIDKLLRSPSDDPHPTTAPASASSNPSAASTSSTNPSAKQFLYRLLRFVKNLLPDPNLQVMTAAANTYGTILRTGGQVFAETLVEIEIQQAVGYMEEQASAPTNLNPNHSNNPAGSTDGVGGYGEWSGSANRARIIASQSSKLLASANATAASTLAITTPGLAPPPTLVIPSVLQQQQLQSPTATTLGGKAPLREKEKILAPHARIAGVLILIQIATHAPQMYYQHTKLILSRILCPLRDGCRFWVVKGSEEDCFAGTDGLEAMVTEGGVRPEDDPNINPLAYARQMTSSNSSMGLSTSMPASSAIANKTLSSTGAATSTQAQGKSNIEARDVVRRLAARLFRVTLAVIASREPGLGHAYGGSSGDMAGDSGMGAAGATIGGDSGVVSRHGGQLRTSSSVSSSSMFGPHAPPQAGNGRAAPKPGAGLRTNKPLVDVATAAANDLSAYLKSVTKGDGRYADPKGRAKSSNQASGKPSPSGTPLPVGNVHRAFGALLIYRELFESGLASLAGLYAGDEDEPMENDSHATRDNTAHHGGSSSNAGAKSSRLVRGGIRYPIEESGSGIDLVPAPQSSTPAKLSAKPQAAPVRKSGPAKIKALDLPTEAFTYPPPYTTIFSLIFYLATRYPTSTSVPAVVGLAC